MHLEAYLYVGKNLPAPYAGMRVLEMGSKVVNGTPRKLIGGRDLEYVGIDIRPGPGVDCVMDAADATLPDRLGCEWDVVLCMEVLEHTPLGEAICHNAHRLLRPGGVFLVTCAGPKRQPHSAEDGGAVLAEGEHYQNISVAELSRWCVADGWWPFSVEEGREGEDTYARMVKP